MNGSTHRSFPKSVREEAREFNEVVMDVGELTTGARLGPFLLGRRLGSDCIGSVWEASQKGGSRVALKVLHAPFSRTSEARERLRQRVEEITRIGHPALEPVQVVETENKVLLLMTLHQGETLRSRLTRQGTLRSVAATRVLRQVASALGAAHRTGIVHGDLKPENIFLRPTAQSADEVLVLDFGLARALRAAGVTFTPAANGGVIDRAPYTSPEQALGQSVDPGSDIWALGIILYEALAGFRPIVGDTRAEFVERLLHDAITPLRLVAPHVPWVLVELAGRMLSRDRARRPNAAEVARALGSLVLDC